MRGFSENVASKEIGAVRKCQANWVGIIKLHGSFSFFIISLTDLATLMKSREFDSKISNSAMGLARYRMFSSVIKGNFNFESV